ncbi:MAG: UshA-like (seleno)protein [Desulfurivibrio sp.]|nr:UshA-like (seleno)protein [Desulfurivibrio sp.]
MQRARQQYPQLLALDAGALLFPRAQLQAGNRRQKLAAARGIAAAYRQMGYEAVGINGVDLAGGLAFLQAIARENPPVWLSADLIDPASQQLLFPGWRLVEHGGWRIGLIALSGSLPPTVTTPYTPTTVALRPWRQALAKALDALGQRPDMVILLSGLSPAENRQLAEEYPDIHLLLAAGHHRDRNLKTGAGQQHPAHRHQPAGKEVGLLELAWSAERRWRDPELARLNQLRQRLDRLNWRWRSLQRAAREKAAAADDPATAGSAPALTDRQQELQATIKEVEQQIKQLEQKVGHRQAASYNSRFLSLTMAKPEDREIAALVDATLAKINDLGRQQAATASRRPAADSPYLGRQSCRPCHQPQLANWQQSRHAAAYQSLVKRHRQYDLNCLGCHLTGASPADRSALLNWPETLRGVGCEACHGPGKAHVERMTSGEPAPEASQRQLAIRRRPAAATCQRCHTPEQSPDFNFRQGLEAIDFP